MKSIMMTYPDFAALPKGVKQMLLASESFFFDETKARPCFATANGSAIALFNLGTLRLSTAGPFHRLWKN